MTRRVVLPVAPAQQASSDHEHPRSTLPSPAQGLSSDSKLPKTMKALVYSKPRHFSVQQVSLPKLRDDDVLVKVRACGVCGTDLHIHDGEFLAKFPLIPGHETIGTVVAIGSTANHNNSQPLKIGDRVCADNSELCMSCFYCRRGELLLCEHFAAHGINLPGGFAEYCAYPAHRVFKLRSGDGALSDVDATLLEPTSCAAHGLDRIRPKMGSTVLMFGAGATGMVLAQLLKQNGGCRVVVVAPEGLKMDLAKNLGIADEYVELSRTDSKPQYEALRRENPYGFDVVVEATGAVSVLQDSINYVRRGGTLVVYGVYKNADKVTWPPTKIFGDEITILGSFSEMYKFPAAVDYLESGKVRVEGIVNKTFKIEQWEECLQSIRNKSAIKAAIVFD